MSSAAGKRVGRVLAGCSKPEARDKPGLLYLSEVLLGFVQSDSRYMSELVSLSHFHGITCFWDELICTEMALK